MAGCVHAAAVNWYNSCKDEDTIMLIRATHILPLTTIERRRVLPVAGTILVRAGQEVTADEVIATADIHAEHITLDLARGLGVPKGKVTGYLRRTISENVPEGGVIASRSGVVSRTVRAPQAGKLVAVGGGQALLQVSRTPYKLLAGIPGTVFKVEGDTAVVIQTRGAWVQGLWGNGKVGVGGLYVAAKSPDHVFTIKDVDPSQRGQVMFAGHCTDVKLLEQLMQIKMRGLILGSMETRIMPAAAKMPYPIMVLEGFGKIPINDAAFKLLSTSGEREISLNASVYNRISGERPEAVIPHGGEINASMPVELDMLDVGKRVRILRAPYQSSIGTVTEVSGVTQLPNGLRTETVEVTLSTEEKVTIPVANIEILG